MKKPYVVPENKKLDNLLQQFKKTKTHIAIVVDEHGGVSGLITLEDALEELVGEIVDETDKDEPHIVPLKPKNWVVLGKTDIDDVNEEIGMEIPDSATYDTFSGYILDAIEKIPAENEEIILGRFVVTVKEKDGNRIIRYTVREMESTGSPWQSGRRASLLPTDLQTVHNQMQILRSAMTEATSHGSFRATIRFYLIDCETRPAKSSI